MALQVKRKNIGQAPTRSNPYLNKTNLPYQKGIIMEEGGELQPGQLSQSDIEKKLALEEVLRQQKLRNNQTNISQYKPKKGDNERMLANKEKYREEQSKPLNKAARSQVAANAMNNIVEPMFNIEMGLVATQFTKPLLKNIGKTLTEESVLKNAYKINPYAEKLVNPKKSYRVAGLDARADFEATGVLRVKTPEVPAGASLIERMMGNRPTGFPSFQKGYADMRYLPEEGGVVFETSLPTYKRGQINPVTGKQIKGRHYAHRVINPHDGRTLSEIPGGYIKMFEGKPHWLKGYQELRNPAGSQETLKGPINYFDELEFKKRNPDFNHDSYVNSIDKFGRPTSANTDHLTPFDMRTLTKEQYKKFMSNERLTKRTYNNPFENFPKKAIGGMFNPFKEKIVPQGTSTESDDYSYEDDMDDMEDDYESQLSEKDIEMDNIMKEKLALERKSRMDNKMIKELSLAKYDMQQEQLAQSLVAMEDEGDFSNENIYSSQSGTGRYGQQIMSELSSSLGYKPVANSIFRTPEKQEELIKQGFGVKNSFHLTGDAVDLKPEDWKKVPDMVKSKMKGKYDVVSHNNHIHIEPKTRFKVGGVYEDIDYKGLEELKKLGYKFEIL